MLNFSVTFFITLVNLAILFVVMRAILFKPVSKFIQSRQSQVKAEIDAAAQQRSEAEQMKADYEAKLAEAKEQSAAIIRDAKVIADRQADSIIAKAKAEAQARMQSAEEAIKSEQQAAAAAFRSEAAALVIAAAAKLLQREFSDEDRRKEAALILQDLARSPAKGSVKGAR
jgi:F-type H+-transporting ATPase subunit b